jgi:Uri superfamily endonuclease
MTDFASELPSKTGTYILRLHLNEKTRLTIGKRGDFVFPAGAYFYAGSAAGSGGLRGRLAHHLRPVRKPHWHIDYLRQAASLRAIWYTVSQTVYEHRWANILLALPESTIIAPGFGSSDCTCPTHLIYLPDPLLFETFQQMTDATVQRLDVSH